MSEFTKTKHHAIDPINFNKYRAEFRLPSGTVLLTKMNLMNIGVVTNAGSSNYLRSTGVKGLIKSINLFDGNQKLDGIQHFAKWSAYNEYANDNDTARDMNNYMSGSGFGFTTRYQSDNDTDKTFTDLQVTTENRLRKAYSSEEATFKGIISLFRELDFLRQSVFVPTTVFNNLRVVIEFQTDMSKVFEVAPASHELLRPFLVCQEIIDADVAVGVVRNYKGVAFDSVEDDIIVVPSNNAGTQDFKHRVNGFNGKFVQKLVVQKEPTYTAGLGAVKEFSSVAQRNEKFNLTLNGKKLLPFDGIDRTNKRLGMLHMACGTHNTVMNFQTPETETSSNVNVDTNVGALVNMTDYIGVNLLERVENLQLSYKRDNINQDEYKQAMNLNVYGRVKKAVVVNGNKYVVEYQ